MANGWSQCKKCHLVTKFVTNASGAHTSYLSFLLHGQDFRKPNFTPQKTTKGTKNTKNVSEKVKYMHFFHSIWKNLHLTENFYTGTACGAGDKYEVWWCHLVTKFGTNANGNTL